MKKIIPLLIIATLAALLFFPFLGRVHLFDWDEINFAECAREMIVTGDYGTVQIGFVPFWEKPPLFIWVQALSMKLWGVNEYAARFPNALCGVVTLIVLYLVGSRFSSHRLGLIWVACYLCSLLPFLYFKSGIIDPWFNLFVFLSLILLTGYILRPGGPAGVFHASASALFLGLAVLTKGPVAILLWSLTFFTLWAAGRFRFPWRTGPVLLFALILVLVSGSWFLYMISTGHSETVLDFIRYQARLFSTRDAGHGGSLLYHPAVLFFGLFPVSLFFLSSFRKTGGEEPGTRLLRTIMLILFFVVLAVFSLVQTKIIHYSSLAYFPMTLLAALQIDRLWDSPGSLPRLILRLMAGIWSFLLVVTLALPFLLMHPGAWIRFVRDPFAAASLQLPFSAGWTDFLPPVVLLAGITAIFILSRHRARHQLIATGLTCLLFIVAGILAYPGKAERHSQRALVEFCRQHQGDAFYLKSVGFKSYAPLFYGNRMPGGDPYAAFSRWLTAGPVDRPVYLITKVHKQKQVLEQNPRLKILGSEGGYLFLKREYPE